jgi:HEAT repeat protein
MQKDHPSHFAFCILHFAFCIPARMTEPSLDVPKESSRAVLFQFVVFPLGIVCVGVAIFLIFGRLAGEEHTIPDYLNEIRSGSKHERWQAAYQLSKSLKRGEARKYPNLEENVAAIYRSAEHDDPRIRQYLAMVLGNIGDRRATPLLLGSLSDPEPETRLYALLALGELRDPVALPRVIELTRDADKDVRKTAFYALGEIAGPAKDPRAVAALAAGLEDQVPDVRWNAAIALAPFGDRRAAPTLRTMLDRTMLDRTPGMREDQKEDALIIGMTVYPKLVGAEARPELQKIAASDPSLRVRDAAKQALAALHR